VVNPAWQRFAKKKIRENRENPKKMSFSFARTPVFLPKRLKNGLFLLSALNYAGPSAVLVSYGVAEHVSILKRLNILTQSLVTKYPEFASLLGEDSGSVAATQRIVAEKANSISKEVYKLNEKYAGVHGEDLFKMTNESVAALQNLAITTTDLESYGKLVDSLYFLVYEGSGSCKRLPNPPPDFAMDIKFLRTGIRHDIDHGEAKDVVKKRAKKGAVFEKFSGKKSPQECGPKDFLAIQMRLLSDLLGFLEKLQS
jgi:hypothetical protein